MVAWQVGPASESLIKRASRQRTGAFRPPWECQE